MTMMEAIMQMKDQISQVVQNQNMGVRPAESRMQNQADHMQKPLTQFQNQHEDYLVMSQISRNSEEDIGNFTTIQHQKQSHKKARNKINQYDSANQMSETQLARKSTSSSNFRQRSETLDLTHAHAESVYKKIKIKSPNKRALQGG